MSMFTCGIKLTFLPVNLLASEVEWPRYISNFNGLQNLHQSSDQSEDIINGLIYQVQYSTPYYVWSWLFLFFCFLGGFFCSFLLFFFVWGGCTFHSPSTLFMLREELRAQLKFWWKNVFSKEKIFVKSFNFWWNSLNWFSLCKMNGSCFHEFYVTFCIVHNFTKI